jgi:hypothetical protein
MFHPAWQNDATHALQRKLAAFDVDAFPKTRKLQALPGDLDGKFEPSPAPSLPSNIRFVAAT